MRKLLFATLLAMVLGFTTFAQANLVDNGGGLIYDTDLNITWYDALATPLVEARTWEESIAWVATLTFGGTAAGSWRMPETVDGPYEWGHDGKTTAGFNIITSEMGHLFYEELGNEGHVDVNGNLRPFYGLWNKAPFQNLQNLVYWSGTKYGEYPDYVWFFNFNEGYQDIVYKTPSTAYALPVHEGNVSAPVPLPSAILLLGPGLGGLALIMRRIGRCW